MYKRQGKITPVKRGDTVCILQDMRHGLKAINDLTLIETQTGLKEKCNRTCEMYKNIMIFVLHNITGEEISEAGN